MKYLYTPRDVAVFFLASDFTQSQERTVLHSIWGDGRGAIPVEYRKDEVVFMRRVYFELSRFDGSLDDLDELNLLLRDTGHALCIDGTIDAQGIIESFFKVIKLELTYVPGRDYIRIKLRSLLKRFDYRRRSAQLVTGIRRTVNALGLKTYLKGHVPCDIGEIGIDDMVVIRLRSDGGR